MNTITVEFNQDELNAIQALLDAAVKATGLHGAKIAMPIIGKFESAVEAVNATPKGDE